jgi:UDP-galactopyranose mutase
MARELAEAGFSVLAIEKRSHIGGNMYEYARGNGVRVHMYGPHIFHTNSREVFEYLSRFTSFYPYTHRVLGRIQGQLVPIPFNFTSMDLLFPKEKADVYKAKLLVQFPDRDRVFISELVRHPDPDISSLGDFIFENVFVHYTAKQWGMPVSQVDTSVINRVPVVLGVDDRYFSDSIQMMPTEGYTPVFEKMLRHPNIHVTLESDAMDRMKTDPDERTILFDGAPFSGPVCLSGPVDEFFKYSLGTLPYRSLDMKFEDLDIDYYQPASVVNYPNEELYTRITEFKHMTLQVLPGHTTILKEYPLPYRPGGSISPYYPISNSENQERYEAYQAMSRQFPNLYLCGRLAEYKYYNMDAAVDRALSVSRQILHDYSTGK